ncbi:biotin carboxylase N-terminal domain-containing protein [Paracoccus sp. (in: a-proteobacteria)]|uniref:biotin carboxylase N-terminal domain-containing protein n=1 Tax=Paracoccus sp. TaxID=267 RepID=UPI003A8A0CDB
MSAVKDRGPVINRREIALRIIRACRRPGLPVICAHSVANRDAPCLAAASAMLIKAAQGQPLPARQNQISASGQAIECRIKAEALHSFAPCPDRIEAICLPGDPGFAAGGGGIRYLERWLERRAANG